METNWLAVLVAAVSSLVTGFIWYHPAVFGKAWMNSLGYTMEDLKKGNMIVILLVSLILAFFLSVFIDFQVNIMHPNDYEDPTLNNHFTFGHGAFHGVVLALMAALPILGINALFERRGFKYIAINVLYWVATLAIMGGILNAWR